MPSLEKVQAIITTAASGAGRAMAIIIAVPTAIMAGILLVAFVGSETFKALLGAAMALAAWIWGNLTTAAEAPVRVRHLLFLGVVLYNLARLLHRTGERTNQLLETLLDRFPL
jgi:hypothetical protein